MKTVSRICALALAAALCLALAACGATSSSGASSGGASSSVSAPSQSASTPASSSGASGESGDKLSDGQRYAYAIRDARSAEDNEYNAVVASLDDGTATFAVNPNNSPADEADGNAQMIFDVMGVDAATVDAYAMSVSLMNVKAYAVAVFKPTQGQEETVHAALESYVSSMRKSFENYLVDQYEVAQGALIETLPGGELVLVMCEGASDVLAGIESALS